MIATIKRLVRYLQVTFCNPVDIASRAYGVHCLGGYSCFEAWEIVCIGHLYVDVIRGIDEAGKP